MCVFVFQSRMIFSGLSKTNQLDFWVQDCYVYVASPKKQNGLSSMVSMASHIISEMIRQ